MAKGRRVRQNRKHSLSQVSHIVRGQPEFDDLDEDDGFPFSPDVLRYVETLARTGMEEREIMRAGIYAETYGLETLDNQGGGCVFFDEPDCEAGWNCLNPEHQVVVKE